MMKFSRLFDMGIWSVAKAKDINVPDVEFQFAEFLDTQDCVYGVDAVNSWRKKDINLEQGERVAELAVEFCSEQGMVHRQWAEELLASANVGPPRIEELLDSLFPYGFSQGRDVMLFPPSRLVSALRRFERAAESYAAKHLVRPESLPRYTEEVRKYLAQFVDLLSPERRLSEMEIGVLLASVHLNRVGHHLCLDEEGDLQRDALRAFALTRDSPRKLEMDDYQDICTWIEGIAEQRTHTRLADSVEILPSDVALVCLGANNHDYLSDKLLEPSGSGSERLRPALLAALLSLADGLATLRTQPKRQAEDDAQDDDKRNDVQRVYPWLRAYLRRITIDKAYIRFHYFLPREADEKMVRVLLTGPMFVRWRRAQDVLRDNGLVLLPESAISTTDRALPIPEEILESAAKLVDMALDAISSTLGEATDAVPSYACTGYRASPTLTWPSVATTDYYKCDLFEADAHVAEYQTESLSWHITDPQLEPGVAYEWAVDAYKDGSLVGDPTGGLFWLVNEKINEWIDRQFVWYESRSGPALDLIQAQILAGYGVFKEAIDRYQRVMAHGDTMQRMQAYEGLIAVYGKINQILRHKMKPKAADSYIDAALSIGELMKAETSSGA